MGYLSLYELLTVKNVAKPQLIDSIHLQHEGLEFEVFGVLHGLTGGTNQEYVKLVNKSIEHVKQSGYTILAEKSMKKMYRGIDHEVEDWLQVPFMDSFRLTLSLFALPWRLAKLIKIISLEKIRKKDRFNLNLPRIQDIGGSAYFHLLEPQARRLIAGFPPPEIYLKENLLRRMGKGTMTPPFFPDKDWAWLNYIEPYVNIPLRSIHMFEYSKAFAQKNNIHKIALFIGEIHNSDIQWYQEQSAGLIYQDKILNQMIEQIKSKAQQSVHKSLLWQKTMYFISIAFSGIISLILYFLLFDISKFLLLRL